MEGWNSSTHAIYIDVCVCVDVWFICYLFIERSEVH